MAVYNPESQQTDTNTKMRDNPNVKRGVIAVGVVAALAVAALALGVGRGDDEPGEASDPTYNSLTIDPNTDPSVVTSIVTVTSIVEVERVNEVEYGYDDLECRITTHFKSGDTSQATLDDARHLEEWLSVYSPLPLVSKPNDSFDQDTVDSVDAIQAQAGIGIEQPWTKQTCIATAFDHPAYPQDSNGLGPYPAYTGNFGLATPKEN